MVGLCGILCTADDGSGNRKFGSFGMGTEIRYKCYPSLTPCINIYLLLYFGICMSMALRYIGGSVLVFQGRVYVAAVLRATFI
jgi:hypothetical protein